MYCYLVELVGHKDKTKTSYHVPSTRLVIIISKLSTLKLSTTLQVLHKIRGLISEGLYKRVIQRSMSSGMTGIRNSLDSNLEICLAN